MNSQATGRSFQRAAVVVALAGAIMAVMVGGAARETDASYRDNAHVSSPATEAFVPMSSAASRQSKLVDTGLALGVDKRAYAWGRVGAGGDAGAALGGEVVYQEINAASGYPRRVPIPGDPELVDLAADRRTAIALDASGQVWAWGAGSFLHPESKSEYRAQGYAPAQVLRADGTALTDITMIAAAERNAAIAVDGDGRIWRWGHPTMGGVDGYLPQLSPLPEGETGTPVSVTGGFFLVSAVLDNGNVYVWGNTTNHVYGGYHAFELPGNADVTPAAGASLVEGLQPWSRENSPDAYVVQVGLGGYDFGYGVALLSDNTLLSWGQNPIVAGHADPTTPKVSATDVVTLAPNFYGVSYLKLAADPSAAGYDLYGYGPANYSLGNTTAAHQRVDTGVTSVQPGMGYNFWLKVDDAGDAVGFFGRGYNPQGAVGLDPTGTFPAGGETTVREIRFPGKPITDLSMLAG